VYLQLLAQYLYGEVPKNVVKISGKQAEASDPLYFFKIYQPELPDIRQFLHIKKSFCMPGKRQIQSQTQLTCFLSPDYMFWIESIHHWALKIIQQLKCSYMSNIRYLSFFLVGSPFSKLPLK